MHSSNGVTLIELLATLLVLAVVIGLGVPSFRGLLLDMRMTTQVNQLTQAARLARYAAHQTSNQVVLCKSADGRRCNARHWHEGWLVFVNNDSDYPPGVDSRDRVLAVGNQFQDGTIAGNRDHFIFRPLQMRSTNGTLTFCDKRGSENSRALVISFSGRTRIDKSVSFPCPV